MLYAILCYHDEAEVMFLGQGEGRRGAGHRFVRWKRYSKFNPVQGAYAFISFLSSLRKRQSVASAIILAGVDLIILASRRRNA